MSTLVLGLALVAVGVVMLRYRDRIARFWEAVLPWPRGKGPPRWYRAYAYVGGPAFLIACGVALLVSGAVRLSN